MKTGYLLKVIILSVFIVSGFSLKSYSAFLPAERLYKEGERCLENNDPHRAYLIFREVVRDHPTSEYADDAHFLIAHYYLQQKDFFQAEKEFLILINNYPDSPFVKDAREYFSKMRSRFLEDKVVSAMNIGDYRAAKAFLEEMLSIDPDNIEAKAKLKEVDNIIARIDLQRKQLEEEKARIEEESKAIKMAREEVARLREEAEKAMMDAERKSNEAASEYDTFLAEAKRKESELERQIAKLENDLKEWRERARKYEARQLAEKSRNTSDIELSQQKVNILFEGAKNDPAPESKEKAATNILKELSPAILLLSETLNEETNIMKAELVLTLDLTGKWLEKHYLKFRVDYKPLPGIETQKPTIIYYTTADMDAVDTENGSYRKKIIVAIDKNKIDKYSVSAFFIKKE